MKSKEEIEQLAEECENDSAQQGLDANGCFNQYQGFIKGYTQCQEDMANKIKEAYEQGLSHGYACMPATISPLNKQH